MPLRNWWNIYTLKSNQRSDLGGGGVTPSPVGFGRIEDSVQGPGKVFAIKTHTFQQLFLQTPESRDNLIPENEEQQDLQ